MFQEIAEGVHVQPSLLYQTQSVVVADRFGVTVIDPNYFPHEILAARELAERLGGHGVGRWLALTHSDFDHIAGVPWFPDFQVLTQANWDLANEERARRAMADFDRETYIARARPLAGPIRRDRGVRGDGEEHLGFLCFHAEGHTRDGLVLHHRASGALIVGDYLSDLEFPFVYVSVRAYAQTLERFARILAEHPPSVLVSQHGPVAFGPEAAARRLDEARGYILGLQAAARQARDADALAESTRHLWRGAIEDALYARHRANADIAVREARGDCHPSQP